MGRMERTFNRKDLDKVDIAERYGVCPRTIQKWMRDHTIPYWKKGRIVRFNVERCDAAIKRLERNEVVFTA